MTVDESEKIAAVARLVQAVTLVASKPPGQEPDEHEWGYLANSAGRVLELVLFRKPTDDELGVLFK